MSSPEPESVPSTLLGGCVLGIYIGLVLYGLTISQTYSYFLTFGDDPQWLKGTVGFLCVCETAYTGCIVHWLYQLTVIGFGSLAIADLVPLTLPISLIIEVTIAVLVQSLYLRRLWIMSRRNWFLITPIAVLLVFRYGACMTTVAFLFRLKKLSAFRSSLTTQATIDAAAYISAASDALIAGSMIYYLRRSQTGFRTSTDGAIRWIIQYLVNTGAITMAVSIALAVTFVAARNSLVFAGLFSVMSRLYANAFLGSLNGRYIIRRKAGDIVTSGPLDRFSTYVGSNVRL